MKKLLFLVLISLSTSSIAERLFDVEVIVFKRNIDASDINERWHDKPPEINMSQTISVFDKSGLARQEIEMLANDSWSLTSEFDKLNRHAGFTPLIHAAWRQDDRGRAQLPKIRFAAGDDFGLTFNADGTEKVDVYDELSGVNQISPKLYQLDGFVRVYVQHYLFIETDLVYRQIEERTGVNKKSKSRNDDVRNKISINQYAGASNDDLLLENPHDGFEKIGNNQSTVNRLISYPFKQKRRMRSGETHYLDHPLLGLIIKVTRVENS